MNTTPIPNSNRSWRAPSEGRSLLDLSWLFSPAILRWVAAVVCLLAATRGVAEAGVQTNGFLTPAQRLERQHLQAVHEARLRFAQERRLPPTNGLYEDFRAVILSDAKDAEPKKDTGPELLVAARKSGIGVVLTVDQGGPKPDAWRGVHESVLFIAGSVGDDATLRFPELDPDGKAIPESGLRLLSRVEEASAFTNRAITGMAICNGRTGAPQSKAFEEYLAAAGADANRWRTLAEDFRSFPDEFYAAGTDYPRELFAKWDQETAKKPLTGIAANNAQQSISLRRLTSDPYEAGFRNLTTHILARELTEPRIREALTNGHVYVAHDWLCDPTGFIFGAVNNLGVFTMGDPAVMFGKTRLMAVLPLSAKLRLIYKGTVISETVGTNLNFEVKQTGPYRLEAWLTVDGEDRPWIYSNPVYLVTPDFGDLSLPSMQVSPEVEVSKDIAYCEGSEEDAAKHKLDIYVPKGKTNAPVLFFVHGGAWKSGDRSNYVPLGNRYALGGLVTVVPSYRLAPKHPHPAQIKDVAAAFAWTVRHIAEHGGDTNRIYVAGHSAGGHLVALLSLDADYLAKYQLSPKAIRGVLAWSGVYNLTTGESQESVFGKDLQKRRAASPLFYVKAGAPPFVVTYCQWDYFSLPGQAREFYHALRQAGVEAELVYVPRESHISEMLKVTRATDPTVTAALKFMKLTPGN
jgi:acetyl esterase/lipase